MDSKFQPGYAHGLGSLQFPNGTSPLVAKTAIYMGNMAAGGTASEEHNLKAPPPPLPLVIIAFFNTPQVFSVQMNGILLLQLFSINYFPNI